MPLAALAVAIYYPFSPGGRQMANMHRADDIANQLRPALARDLRFADIKMGGGTVDGGSLYVVGSVPDQAAVDELRAMVDRMKPDIAVKFRVFVGPPE